jgi:hypothetical protein
VRTLRVEKSCLTAAHLHDILESASAHAGKGVRSMTSQRRYPPWITVPSCAAAGLAVAVLLFKGEAAVYDVSQNHRRVVRIGDQALIPQKWFVKPVMTPDRSVPDCAVMHGHTVTVVDVQGSTVLLRYSRSEKCADYECDDGTAFPYPTISFTCMTEEYRQVVAGQEDERAIIERARQAH